MTTILIQSMVCPCFVDTERLKISKVPKWLITIMCRDIEGQIERCHERIRDNILPHIFEQRLSEYEAKRAYRE
jgi:hypothetical protein